MDHQEIKDHLQGVINALIKDQPDQANQNLHDVLAAKMRARISPQENIIDNDNNEDFDDENELADDQNEE